VSNPVADGAAAEPRELTEPVVIGYPDHKGVRVERVTYPNIRFETVIADGPCTAAYSIRNSTAGQRPSS
jgi:hypothetical protein